MDTAEATPDFDPKRWIAGTDATETRLLHTMLCVRDPQASLRFYVDVFGMKVVDVVEIETTRLTAYFLGSNENQTDGFLELAHFWDAAEPYSHGTGFGHVSIGAPDFAATLTALEALGTEFLVRPMIMFPGGPQLALVKDPDGYTVEFIQARRD
jgi:lactoylglutathione lyase